MRGCYFLFAFAIIAGYNALYMSKLQRKTKRAKYTVSFEQRYNIKRKEWVKFKKESTPAEVNTKRVSAIKF